MNQRRLGAEKHRASSAARAIRDFESGGGIRARDHHAPGRENRTKEACDDAKRVPRIGRFAVALAAGTALSWCRRPKKKRRRYTLEQLLAGLSREDKIGWGPPRAIVAIASTVVGTGFPAGLGAAKTRLSDSQGETPNSFSISDIIGCVKPALRNAAKSAAMTRSHSLASCCDIGLPL